MQAKDSQSVRLPLLDPLEAMHSHVETADQRQRAMMLGEIREIIEYAQLVESDLVRLLHRDADGEELLDFSDFGVVELTVGRPGYEIDGDRLVSAILARAKTADRTVNVDGEIETDVEAAIRVLEECFSLKGYNARWSGVKKHGMIPDRYRERKAAGKLSAKIRRFKASDNKEETS